jgi:DNA ligase-1
MSLTKLYKKDSKGKIREWAVAIGHDKDGDYYEMTHGLEGGAMQVNRTYIAEGKNIGRSNETTPAQQVAAEAAALWTKQRDRKGYSEATPQDAPLKPMLAKVFEDESHKVVYPCAIQSKLDGSRCLAHITEDGVKLISRTMKEYVGLDHIANELAPLYKKHGEIILDGELFNKDISFQEIMSLVRKTENLSTESCKIQYWVYDTVDLKSTFHQRYINWSNIIAGLTNVRPTPTFIVKTESEVLEKHRQFIKEGWEGTMVRNLDSLYKLNSRSSDLLKLKDFNDDEFKVIGYKAGTGKFKNVPTFQMVTAAGHEFEGVPKGTEEQRKQYLDNGRNYIGKLATVRFFGYTTTDNPVPRFPIIVDLDRKE